MSSNDGLYVSRSFGSSVLEIVAVLGDVLRPQGYSSENIQAIAVGIFLDNERTSIREPSPLHLLAIKKALLYAIPVVSPPDANRGIQLTSQVNTPAIQYGNKRGSAKATALAIGDKYRLLGFTFPPNGKLVNHLRFDLFPWKYDAPTAAIDLSTMDGIETKYTDDRSALFIIKPQHYENEKLFNSVNKIIARRLETANSTAEAMVRRVSQPTETLAQIGRISPMNNKKYLSMINDVLTREADPTYYMSLYEALYLTGHQVLFDQIHLLGIESPEVKRRLAQLKYIKDQTRKVRANVRDAYLERLASTRAEKISRERYPYYFDFADHRVIFSKFKRFAIDKLPVRERKEVAILLKKELDAQKALLHNKCEHIAKVKILNESDDISTDAYDAVEDLLNRNGIDEHQMIPCRLCLYPLMCAHEVEFYDAVVESRQRSGDNDGSDTIYWIKQKIINRYKVINQQRTGMEDTETRFMYYCKHCGSELGMSEDAIQFSKKDMIYTTTTIDSDPMQQTIYKAVVNTIATNMATLVVPASSKTVIKLLVDEIVAPAKELIARIPKSIDQDKFDITVKYIVMVYTLSAMIALNLSKLRGAKSILKLPVRRLRLEASRDEVTPDTVAGGKVMLKDEMIMALKIVQSNEMFKQVGVTSDKIKALLVDSLKQMNKAFSNESVQLKQISPKEQMRLNIVTHPVTAYATEMLKRKRPRSSLGELEATGIDLDALFPKGKTRPKATSHALFKYVFQPDVTPSSDSDRYKREAYQSIVALATAEPINGRYTSIVTPPPSDFVVQYEANRAHRLRLKRITPTRFLPVENSREHDFRIKSFDIAYCNVESATRPHRWSVTKADKTGKLVFTCRICQFDIDKADKRNDGVVEERLDNQMTVDAFFEFYALVCPVKDGHAFGDSGKCEHCGVAKSQLSSHDSKYYKRHVSAYLKRRKAATAMLLEDTKRIINRSTPLVARTARGRSGSKSSNNPVVSATEKEVDVKLRSLAGSLNSSYQMKRDFAALGVVDGRRSLATIDSYVRILYSHFIYVKNLSINTTPHPDSSFTAFVKDNFYTGVVPNAVKLDALPEYPKDSNPHRLLVKLLQIIYDISSKGTAYASKLVPFILEKIIKQDERHGAFDFAKLKATSTAGVYEDSPAETTQFVTEDDEDDEVDMFDGYDIDPEDAEDNANGEY